MQEIDKNGFEKEIDFSKLEISSYIDPAEEIKRQPIALSIGEYYYAGNHYPIPFGSYGDFSCIVGASKSKKTFLKSAMIASYIGGRAISYFPKMKGHDTSEKFVLDIDTEQSRYHTQRVVRRVCDMVGSNYEFYKSYSLRKEDAKIRFQFIEWLLLESEYRNNIGLVSVDGSADLLDNVNDLEESNRIVQSFMKCTQKSNCHLITVLHRNHGTMKPTGHLGSAILKKAETVAFVEKVDNLTKVSCEYSRNMPFDDFTFGISERFLPYETSSYSENVFD